MHILCQGIWTRHPEGELGSYTIPSGTQQGHSGQETGPHDLTGLSIFWCLWFTTVGAGFFPPCLLREMRIACLIHCYLLLAWWLGLNWRNSTRTHHTHTHCTLTHHTPTFPPMAPPPGIHVCLPTHLTPQPPFWVLVGSRLLLKPSLFYPRRGTTYPLMHLHQMCCLLKRDQNILPSLSSANTQPRDKTQGQSRAKTCWARLFLPSHIYTIVIFSQICGFFLFPSFFSLFPSSLFFSPQVPLRVHRLWHEQGWLNAHYHVSTWRALKCLQGHLEFSTMLGAPHSLYVRPASLI